MLAYDRAFKGAKKEPRKASVGGELKTELRNFKMEIHPGITENGRIFYRVYRVYCALHPVNRPRYSSLQ